MDDAESNPNSEIPNSVAKDVDIKSEDQLSSSTEQVSTEIIETKSIDLKDESADDIAKSEEVILIDDSQVKLEEIKEKTMMGDDDGEDLPDNFFDDFSNNDFMAGLDIVDDWMDEEEDLEKRQDQVKDDYFQDDALIRDRSQDRKKEPSPRRRRRENRHSRNRERSRDHRRSRDRDFDRRRSRSRERLRHERRSRDRFRSRDHSKSKDLPTDTRNSRNNSKEKQKSVEDSNVARRDPEKTKQDIQRDKIRCAKDFEARVFQEQIKVAESGLVPPGTELDVVLEHEKRKMEEEQKSLEKPENKIEEPVLQPERKRSSDRIRTNAPTHSKNHSRHSRERRSRERHDRPSRERPAPPSREQLDRLSRERISRERRERSRERRSRERYSREKRSRERRSRERRSRERHSRDIERLSREIRRSRDRSSRDRRRYSPEYRSRKREYNRLDRSLSPRVKRRSRSLDREELLRQNDDLRLRIREKRREKLLSELSPVSEAKFSRSPSLSNLSLLSNVSERECWLRNRDKHKSRYRRSCSPISSSSLSDAGSPRRKRKKASFMEEIERKLQQTQPPTFVNHPQPVPPPPQQFPQPMGMPFPPQNQQMFPGMAPNPYVHQGMNQNMMMQQPMPLMDVVTTPMMGGQGILGPMPGGMVDQPMMPQGFSPMPQLMNPMMQVQLQPGLNSPAGNFDNNVHRTQSNLKPCVSDANKEVTKLFEEQKISLSDYLSVAAKPIDPTLPPINVHKKIQVISKCQDVIRVLKEDTKFCGRFFPKPTPPGFEKPEEKAAKWRSPMRKTFPIRFMFTTPCRKTPLQQDFVKTVINKLLFVCGIPALPKTTKAVSAAVKHTPTIPKPNTAQPISTHLTTSAPKPIPAPVCFTVAQQKPKNSPLPQPSVLVKRSTIGSQTDPVKCQICEIRSARKFTNEACQTAEKETVDEATQVTNEDLQKSIVTFTPRGILKNSGSNLQSLSHLTPAQLLCLQQEKNDDGWNIAPRSDNFAASRNLQDPFSTPGNFSGRGLSTNMNRLGSNTGFNPNFGGSPEKFPFREMGNKSVVHMGSSMGDFQNMGGNRFPNDRYSPEDSFMEQNTNFNRNMGNAMNPNMGNMNPNMGNTMNPNMGNTMNQNIINAMNSMPNRGRGGPANRGFFGGNFGGQNRQFYN